MTFCASNHLHTIRSVYCDRPIGTLFRNWTLQFTQKQRIQSYQFTFLLYLPTIPTIPINPQILHTGITPHRRIVTLKRHIRRLKRQGITYKDTIAQLPITIHTICYTTSHTVHISPLSGSYGILTTYSQRSVYTILYPCSIMPSYRILTLLYAINPSLLCLIAITIIRIWYTFSIQIRFNQ